jgi:hypothetical protein
MPPEAVSSKWKTRSAKEKLFENISRLTAALQ